MTLYPPIEPFRHGMLDVGDGHRVYWEASGNPDGKPALVLHGGPGSGATAGARRFFDPSRYLVVLFDQRNCGRSTPHGSEPDVDLSANDTAHLVADIELLREHLGVAAWLVRGPSWGSVLALAYAQAHPDRVTELVLMGLATGRRAETDLLSRGLGPMFPDAWARFAEPLAAGEHPTDGYHRLLFDADPAVRDRAASAWCDWETAILPTSTGPNPRFADRRYRLCFARIVTHYWRNDSFLAPNQVLDGMSALRNTPGVLIQGVLDLSNLVGTPWLLHQAWPGSELVMVDETGHEGSATTEDLLVATTDRFAPST